MVVFARSIIAVILPIKNVYMNMATMMMKMLSSTLRVGRQAWVRCRSGDVWVSKTQAGRALGAREQGEKAAPRGSRIETG